MDINKLILMIDGALKEVELITDTSTYFRASSEPIKVTKKVLLLLKEEVLRAPENINLRVLRAMHDIGMSSYKDFEYTPVEQSLNNITDILFDEIPIYRELIPLGSDFGKGYPI